MKRIVLSILLVAGFLLTACSSSLNGTPASSASSEIPVGTQLAVGTLKLSGTEQDVTAEQADQLLILWQTYKQLLNSDTAAQAEVDALTEQIQETMSTAQMQVITDMNITQKDVFTSMQGVTVASNNSSGSTVSVPSSSSGGGGMPAGGPPAGGGAPQDGGGGMPMDMGGGASTSSTSQGSQTSASTSTASGIPSALVEAVIQFLQQKTAG